MFAAVWHSPAKSQIAFPCANVDKFRVNLKRMYKEVLTVKAVVDNGKRMETYVSPVGTWSTVIIREDDLACLVMTGTNWERIIKGENI